uniref:Tubulin-specific chaperone cofactor E-like protein n=1 Tax=Syphacia muris TaxID=451379 RepID=A0A0N5ALA7_9BILA
MFSVDDDTDNTSSLSCSSTDSDCSCPATLVEALEKKYLNDEDVDSSMLIISVTPCKLASECALSLLVLDHKGICTVGDTKRFFTLAKNVVEVDVSFNNFVEWEEIGKILSLKKLQTLNVGYNPLKDNIDTELPMAATVTALYLCGTELSLTTIRKLLKSMPMLAELKIKNGVDDENCLEPISVSVRTQYLIRCEISDWKIVILLRRLFPNCEHLVLCENPIKKVEFGEEENSSEIFKGLRYLSLRGCLIDDWESIEGLSEIDTLKSMKLQQIPLLNNYTDDEKYHLIIGRLPYLEELNGLLITEEHRITSERAIYRYYDNYETKPKIFDSLISRHGHLAPLCSLDLSPKKSVSVVVVCEEKQFSSTLKVPRAVTVIAFKRILGKRLNVSLHSMRLFYMGPPDLADVFMAEELRFPSTKLSSMRVEDGDRFSVQLKA